MTDKEQESNELNEEELEAMSGGTRPPNNVRCPRCASARIVQQGGVQQGNSVMYIYLCARCGGRFQITV